MARYGLYTLPRVRDIETIDSELRLLAAVRRSIREHSGEPSSRQVDEFMSAPRSATHWASKKRWETPAFGTNRSNP